MAEHISKSEQKRRFKRVEEAAVELALLGDGELQILPVSALIKEEIRNCRSVKGGAKKRQIKYLAKIIREEEATTPLLDFLAQRKGSKLKKDALHHEAERLRDMLIDEALACRQELLQMGKVFTPEALSETSALYIAARFHFNKDELSRLLYQYGQSRAQNCYREVFRMIKNGLEYEERAAALAKSKQEEL